MTKPRIIKDYDKLTEELKEQLKVVYPKGYVKHLITFTNKEGQLKKGLPFETEEYMYLVRMNEEKAEEIIDLDDDYNDNGMLKKSVKERYEDKYEDVISDLNDNEDNDLGDEELDDDDF